MYVNLCAWSLPKGIMITDEDSLRKVLKLAKESGYDAIEMRMEAISEMVKAKSVSYVKDIFAEYGIKPAAWQMPDCFWEAEYEYSWRSDEAKYQKLLEVLPFFAQIARDLECPNAFTWPVSYSDEMDFMTNFRWHVKRLKPVASILKYYGGKLGLEWMGPITCRAGHKYEFIHDMDGALALCEAIDPETIGLLLDSWHWYTSKNTIDDILKLKPEQIIYVHFNDAPAGVPFDKLMDLERAVAGETNVIDLVGFLKALKQIGYQGPIEPCAPGAKSLEGKTLEENAKYGCDATKKLFKLAGI